MAGLSTPVIYDLRGLKCPMPILKTVRRLKDMAPGGHLTILSDDPLAEQDLIDLCDSQKYNYNFNSIHHDGYIEFTICIPPY